MTHLRIEQNNGVIETVASSVVSKLYELVSAGLDESSTLVGRISVPIAYREQVEYLQNKYKDLLYIQATNYAIPFEDPNMLAYLNSIGVGSGGFVTEQQAANTSIVANSVNTTVKKFNEFKYFTNITSSRTGWTGTNSGYMRFTKWTALEEIDISNLMSIGHNNGYAYEDTFRECTALKTVKASDKLRHIGHRAFSYCSNLEEISGLEGRIEVCQEAFYGCSKLTSDNFENVEFVLGLYSQSRDREFENCSRLQNITLHADTTRISTHSFSGCSILKSIIMHSTTPPTIGDGTTAYNMSIMGNIDVSVYVPDDALSTYQSTVPYSGWGAQLKPLSEFSET